jgi:two-component system, LytTR family, sensor kinase
MKPDEREGPRRISMDSAGMEPSGTKSGMEPPGMDTSGMEPPRYQGQLAQRASRAGQRRHRLWPGLRAWIGITCGWTALALFFAVSASLTYRSTGRPANWTLSIQRSLVEWWLWAALTPLIVWLARRYPLDGRWPWRHGTIHVVSGTIIATAKTVGDRAAMAWLTGFWMYFLVSSLALQFTIYCAIVAAAHGLTYYERSRERDHLETRLAQARLQMLAMQLQPHFLFNTLNTIAELVHSDPDIADRMIIGLSDLLRRTLEFGPTQEIPLEAELDLLRLYLDIQQARFGDRLHVHIAVTTDARDAAVPVLLLQPLVENAIRHGLAERLAAGRIDIAAHRRENRVIIAVSNDGAPAQPTNASSPERIGLGNTRARLDALYGSDHRLDLLATPDRGACVTVDIPFHPARPARS